jgi:hypothetical protein
MSEEVLCFRTGLLLKKKPFNLGAIRQRTSLVRFQVPMAIHRRASGQGILAFSRNGHPVTAFGSLAAWT